MASKKINYTELDFDGIRNNLIEFLKGQSTFTDYNFEGSGLSVLIDLLSYNTMYNGVYNNLSINEMFLDSARKRNSVVSISKELGYRPQSATCATATVNITMTSASPTTFIIPANTPFLTTIDGVTYTFYNSSVLSSNTTALSYIFQNIVLTEKKDILTFDYNAGTNTKYIIPNKDVDLNTLNVRVQDSISSSTITTFTISNNIVDITSTSNVYWVKEIDDGSYELTFGNGKIGTALSDGNIVKLDYCVSSLEAPNGAKLFTYGGTLIPGVYTSIITQSAASGGSSAEDIESIRYNAPRAHSAQNRGVTIDDYKALIYSNFPDAKSVSAWSGEDNIPPVYGKTYICVKPKNSDVLTNAQKDTIIKSILAQRNVVTITPVIVDPEIINIILNVTVYYNELTTTRTAETIRQLIIASLVNYNSTELQKFDGIFRYSKVSKLIDNTESSIINNITTVTLKRYVTPKYNILSNYVINLINPIYYSGAAEDIVISTGFYIEGSSEIHYLVDDGVGKIILFNKKDVNYRTVVNPSIGTVDYARGVITIVGLKINSIVGDYFTFYIKPSSNDVVSALTQIAELSIDDLNVNVISDKTSSGDLRGGQNYTFTSSRT